MGMNLENIKLNETHHQQKITYYVTLFIWNVQDKVIYKDKVE